MGNKKYQISVSGPNILAYRDHIDFIYYENAKCGSRSICRFLRWNANLLNKREEGESHEMVEYNPSWDDYFQFSFVRNPYDRLLSCFLDKTKKVIGTEHELECYSKYKDFNFKEFVMSLSNYPWESHDSHMFLQSEAINIEQVRFIGKMETFQRDFYYVVKVLGLEKRYKNDKLLHLNRTSHDSYHKYYDNEMTAKVYSIYKEDFKRFCYKF